MNNAEWLSQRRSYIGASESAAILSESRWSSPYSVWANKVYDLESIESDAMRWGTILEPVIAEQFCHWAEENIPDFGGIFGDGKTCVISRDYSFIGCSPDRWVCDSAGENIGLLEVKTASNFTAADWVDGIPLYYQIQVQHQLYVTGLQQAWLAVLIGGSDFRVYPVERNDRFITMLVKMLVAFWEGHVMTQMPPPTDATADTTETLKRLHPQDSGATIELDADTWLERINRLERIKKAIKTLEERKTGIENQLRAVIGEATYAIVADQKISLKTQVRPVHQVNESTFRVLRIGRRTK